MHGSSKLSLVGPSLTSNVAADVLVYASQVMAYKAPVLPQSLHCIHSSLLRMLSLHRFEERMAPPLDVALPRANQTDAGEVSEVFPQDLSAELAGY